MLDPLSFAPGSQAQTAGARATLTNNYDTFLTLLTAQLQNQDPLEPVDLAEFTNQLVQFSSVEQQILTNENFSKLISVNAASAAAGLSGYLSKSVDLEASTATFSGDPLTFTYDVPQGAAAVELQVRDADNRLVYSEAASSAPGNKRFVWDGSSAAGNTVPGGAFTFEVAALTSGNGRLSVPAGISTRITGFDFSSGGTIITTPAGSFDFSRVQRISET